MNASSNEVLHPTGGVREGLLIYNTLSRQKELFKPLVEGRVGMYVCGPTVYGDAHLGHARPAITFDLLFRYLQHIGYKVRYVRNITDVGHLEHDADEGEDKIAKKARLEQLEPMEVAQYYTNRFHDAMRALNCLPPSIEPHASGHIIEQIQLVKEILDNGFAYESQGSVYFDIEKYNEKYHYGRLSGRNLGFRPVESRSARAYHAMAVSLERRFPRLALRVHCYGPQVSRRTLRHSRRRHGSRLPSPRVRDCAGSSLTGS